MHLNDARDGTNVGKELVDKYKTALEQKGMISQNDRYKDWISVKQGHRATVKSFGFAAW